MRNCDDRGPSPSRASLRKCETPQVSAYVILAWCVPSWQPAGLESPPTRSMTGHVRARCRPACRPASDGHGPQHDRDQAASPRCRAVGRSAGPLFDVALGVHLDVLRARGRGRVRRGPPSRRRDADSPVVGSGRAGADRDDCRRRARTGARSSDGHCRRHRRRRPFRLERARVDRVLAHRRARRRRVRARGL